jgi:Spy/CpxP family protein refolding chaperone
MKVKLSVILLLFGTVASATLSASDNGESNAQGNTTQLLPAAVAQTALEHAPTTPDAAPREPKELLQNYDAEMIGITQRFSAALAAVAQAVQRGELSSEQGKEISAELYQLTQMQFELLSLWRGMLEQDLARIPAAQANPAPTQEKEVVTVALPFSTLQINSSLAEYLNLTPSQVQTIQQLLIRERRSLQPLITQLRSTEEKLLAIGIDRLTEKEVKALGGEEATLLAKLIVANARMQSKIYKVLSLDQQKKLNDLKTTH